MSERAIKLPNAEGASKKTRQTNHSVANHSTFPAAPSSLKTDVIQRKAACSCGGGCPACENQFGNLQTKLYIGSPTDSAEAEADRAAEEVVRMKKPKAGAESTQSRKTNVKNPVEKIQTKISSIRPKAGNAGKSVSPPKSVHQTLRSAGQPLEAESLEFMEQRFGYDFSRVRVHADGLAARSAEEINARAYTVGQNVVFGNGQYQPATTEGRLLLAHELAHVVQQDGTNSMLHRQLVTPLASGGGFGGVMERDRHQMQPPDSSITSTTRVPPETVEPPVNLLEVPIESDEMVQRVVISCSDGIIAFVTGAGVHIYELTTCEIPIGVYQASVAVRGNNVLWTIGTHEGEGFIEQARFAYRIRRGQTNPATLFHNQRSVMVESAAHVEMPDETAPERCQLAMRERQLIAPQSFTRQLFDPLSFERLIWAHTIPLAQFGWVEVSVTASGDANGTFAGSYGPGTLSNICLYRRLARGRIGGNAHFSFPGSLNATLRLVGRLRLAGEYLSVIPVAAINGEIDATAQANGRAAINSDVEVAYNPSADAPHPWEFTANNRLDVQGSLSFRLNTHLGVEFLTREIWGQTWNLVDREIGAAWQGGLIIHPDLSLEFNSGDIAVSRGSTGTVGVSNTSGGGSPPSSPPSGGGGTGITLQKIVDVLTAVYDESNAQAVANPVIAHHRPPYSRYSLGAPGAEIDPNIIDQAYNLRVNTTDMSYQTFFSNIAVLSAEVDGTQRYFVSPNDPGELHSESMLFRQVEAVDRTYRRIRLLQLYTEREPCGNCRRDLIGIRELRRQDFPVFYSIPRSRSADENATRLMRAYGLTPQ